MRMVGSVCGFGCLSVVCVSLGVSMDRLQIILVCTEVEQIDPYCGIFDVSRNLERIFLF